MKSLRLLCDAFVQWCDVMILIVADLVANSDDAVDWDSHSDPDDDVYGDADDDDDGCYSCGCDDCVVYVVCVVVAVVAVPVL